MSDPRYDRRTEGSASVAPADLEAADQAPLERDLAAYVERTALTPPADLAERVAASLAHVAAPTPPVGFARAIAAGNPAEAVRGFVDLLALLVGRRRGGSILRLQAAGLVLVTLLALGVGGTGAAVGARALGGLLLRPPASTLVPSTVPRGSPSPTPSSSPSPGPTTPPPTSPPSSAETPEASSPPSPTAGGPSAPTPSASDDHGAGATPSVTAEPSGSDDDGSGGSPSGSGSPDGPDGSASPSSSP